MMCLIRLGIVIYDFVLSLFTWPDERDPVLIEHVNHDDDWFDEGWP